MASGCSGSNTVELTRREFIGGVSTALITATLPGLEVFADQDRALTWAMLADTHIHPSRAKKIRGSYMAENLQRVVDEIVEAKPDRILVNGDMAHERGKPAAYDTFHQLLRPIYDLNVPIHFTLGNHDHRDNFLRTLARTVGKQVAGRWVSAVMDSGWQWIFLDSLTKVDGLSGRLGKRQLQWLDQRLARHREAPTMVCVHHNPKNTLLGLRDAQELLDVLVRHRQVKALLYGHTHSYVLKEIQGLHLVNLPATGYSFSPWRPLGWVRARIEPEGMDVELRALDRNRSKHGERLYLRWRNTT